MSLLKWKEFAKSKTELGNKINYVHDLIKRHNIGQETSQESFKKVFKPVTTKLDDVVKSNLTSRIPPQRRKQPPKKGKVPDYGIDIEDEVEDMNFGDLYDEQPIPPQQDKQLGPIPTIHVDPPDAPPKYDYDEEVDYAIHDEDLKMDRLNELSLKNYQDLEEVYTMIRKWKGKINWLIFKRQQTKRKERGIN